MADSFSGMTGEPRGLIRISTSLRLGREHVSPILSLLRQHYGDLDIYLELLDRRVDLLGESFDIDVRVGDVQEPHLIAHKIVDSVRILCASPDYLDRAGVPRSLGELAQHDCLLFRDRDRGFGVWRMSGPDGDETVKVTGPIASNHSDIVTQWALDGYGLLSRFYCSSRLPGEGDFLCGGKESHQRKPLLAAAVTSCRHRTCDTLLAQQ